MDAGMVFKPKGLKDLRRSELFIILLSQILLSYRNERFLKKRSVIDLLLNQYPKNARQGPVSIGVSVLDPHSAQEPS